MRLVIGLSVAVLVAVLPSCADPASGEPLVATTLQASYDGTAFTPINGFATVYMGAPLIIVGDGPVHCGSESASSPPRGRNASIRPTDFVVGSYSNVFVQLFENVGGFEGVGSNDGTLSIDAVNPDTIEGTISYSYTDMGGRMFSLSGSFEVIRCP